MRPLLALAWSSNHRPPPPRLDQRRHDILRDMCVALGLLGVGMTEESGDDLLPGAHDGIDGAGGMTGAVGCDVNRHGQNE